MVKELPRLKLGKRASFVKTHLRQSPQVKETWEADFRALPKATGESETHYLGVVVALPKGDPLVYMSVEYTPNVNDLADLLANAMRRPLTGSARRPRQMHFRNNPRWEELYPHLNELGIETSIQEDLPHLEIVYEDFLRQMRKRGSGLQIIYFPGPPPVDEQFPVIARWVRHGGWIEVGQQKETGIVVRALNGDSVVFEDEKPTTLAEAMAALEKGVSEWLKRQGIEIG
jgi:hypothetical protein